MKASPYELLEEILKLANQMAAPNDPNYKDEWEKGFDAGQESAGRDLLAAFRRMGHIE